VNICNSITNYILIIAEKPKSAKKIVDALSENSKVCKKYNVQFWILNVDNVRYVVAPAAGHLFTLSANGGFPVFEAHWKPVWLEDSRAIFIKKYYNLLKFLCSRASYFINACDYDIEGSVIGYLIIKFFGDVKKAKRMKFSSLTKSEILRSFRNLSELDYNMINAGILRHKVDWLWGINVSRALMRAIEEVVGNRKKIVLSAGRVQSPTLINIVNREYERLLFIPKPEFKLQLTIKFNNNILKLYLDKTFDNIHVAEKTKNNLINRKVIIKKLIKKETIIERPPPFNLGDLQAEAGRIFNISPYKTERIAEELYLEGLISYPRTNSQQLPPSIDINEIVLELSKGPYSKLINLLNSIVKGNRYIVKQGNKTDPAHPAIHPTGLAPSKDLSKQMRMIYELILRRFLASISKDAVKLNKTYIIDVEGFGEILQVSSSKIVDKGWMLLYPYYQIEEGKQYEFKEGEEGIIIDVNVVLVKSKPPSRYTKVSLLRWMEEVEIGTESTRARIIETLFKRKYVKSFKGYIIPTKLGFIIAEILGKYFRELTDVKMTSELDRRLAEIQLGKANHEEIWIYYLNKIKEYINKFNDSKVNIGLKLAKAFKLVNYKKCKLCEFEEYKEGLCNLHYLALQRVNEALKLWFERAHLSKEEVLKLISKNKYTGKYIKDVINSYNK